MGTSKQLTQEDVRFRGWSLDLILELLGDAKFYDLTDVEKAEQTERFKCVNAAIRKQANQVDKAWQDALSKLELIAWQIKDVPLEKLPYYSPDQAPRDVVSKLLFDNFPFDTFEPLFKDHEFANDANVILQERILKSLAEKYPTLKAACSTYFD